MSRLYLGALALTLAGCHLIFPFNPASGPDGGAADAEALSDISRRDQLAPADGAVDAGPAVDAAPAADAAPATDGGIKKDASGGGTIPVAMGGAGFDYLYAVTTDAKGNLYLAGGYEGTATLGGHPLPAGAAKSNAVVVSLTSAGAVRWVRTVEGPGVNLAHGVAHWGGRVFVTGRFEGTAKIGTVSLVGKGSGDVFVAGLDDITGSPIWARTLGGSQLDIGWDLDAENGRVCVVGQGAELTDHLGGSYPTAGTYDAFVALYGTTGSLTWVRRIGGTQSDVARGAALDAAGSCAVAGEFNKTINIGADKHSAVSAYQDVFVARLSATNVVQASIAFGSSLGDSAQDIVYASTDLVITGHYAGATTGALGLPAPVGNTDIFVAKLDKNMTAVWSGALGSTKVDVARRVAIDSAGRVVVVGQVQGTLPGSAGGYVPAGTGDAVLARFTSAGAFEWLSGTGAPGKYAEAWGVASAGAGSYYWVGRFDGALKGYPLTSAGGIDGFLLRYAKP